ncbi:hypothetical protein HH310_28830 [Actinoplanes sp. TBRC 11911]|uniref:hypothetical protein n=1 Tax=Actinoplanes sp. TBRC 11911 TaxID=2729386 RepID=UPI00145F6E67|nr:hypothetical protein [Actinoplanes sp. TBRC 11911]NMO55177.1 hypothetical protein [Actinoplanes sp. TBRC 11911]
MTTVRVPVRVRLEVAADRVGDGLVALVGDAAGAALDRAVRRARTVHAVTRAPASGRRPAITVRFTGDELPRGIAAAVEEALRGGIELAAERMTRSWAPAEHGRDRTEHAEPYDEDRFVVTSDGATGYRVPYYDRGGAAVTVPLCDLTPDPVPEARPAQRLRRIRSNAELLDAIMVRTGGYPPDRFVAIRGDADTGVAIADFIDVETGPDGTFTARRRAFADLGIYQFPGGKQEAVLHGVSFVDADRWSVFGSATGTAQVEELLIEAISVDLLRRSPQADQALLHRQARKRLAETGLHAGNSVTVFQLTAHGKPVWIGPVVKDLPRDTRPVLVLTEDDPEEHEDTYGKCPPLDAEEPSLWLSLLGLQHDDPRTPDMPFLGEPAIENLPAHVAERLATRVQSLAGLLHMQPGAFVGGFLIGALVQVDRNCRILTSNRAPMMPQIKAMAEAFGPLTALYRDYLSIMINLDLQRALPCPVAGHASEWAVRFTEVFGSAQDDAVASMFVSTCQDVLLQTLYATGEELSKRAMNFASYMSVTRLLLVVMLADTVELMRLRDALIERENRTYALIGSAGSSLNPRSAAAWQSLTEDLLDSLGAGEPVSHEPVSGTVTRQKDGFRVYDGDGRWWSRKELDALITAQRRQVAQVDSLVDKVSEVDDLVRELKLAQALDNAMSTELGHQLTGHVDDIFRNLLTELLKSNGEWQRKAARDRSLAFGLASFSRDDIKTASDIGATLAGIHKLADDRLRPAFTDQDAYVAGMRRLANAEIDKAAVFEILNLVGITVLAIFCPPLALGVGLVQAYEGLETAFEHRDLQRSMLDGDEILSKAQVEAEMWAAVIGAALTVLPEAPALARGAAGVSRAVARGQVAEAAGIATRQAMKQIAEHLAALSLKHFTKTFAIEMTKGYLLQLALNKAVGRIAEAVSRQVGVTGHASPGDVFEVLGRAIEGA